MAEERKKQALAGAKRSEREIHKQRVARNKFLASAKKHGATYAEMHAETGMSVEGIRKAINIHNAGAT